MLLFRSEEEIDEWCAAQRLRRGGVIPVAQLQRLARRWYDDRLDADWRPRSLEESQAILTDVGLVGDFWRLG